MNILIVNGGKEAISDPASKVVNIMEKTLNELNVETRRIDLFKEQYSMPAFQLLMEKTEGIILAVTIEWVGIGAKMQKFLDLCWNLREHTIFKDKYCLAVALSKKTGEKEAIDHLSRSWMMLGGHIPEQLSGVVHNGVMFEKDQKLKKIIEKKVEDYYRMISQKREYLPNSIKIKNDDKIEEPKEQPNEEIIEQLDEKQQKDIFEITQLFKEKLKMGSKDTFKQIKQQMDSMFDKNKAVDVVASFQIYLNGEEQLAIVVEIKEGKMKCFKGEIKASDITITTDLVTWEDIMKGKIKAHTAFLLGKIKVKGQIMLLNTFDNIILNNKSEV